MLVILGLTFGNFAYQLLTTEPNMVVAFERSFFQATAIGVYILYNKVNNG